MGRNGEVLYNLPVFAVPVSFDMHASSRHSAHLRCFLVAILIAAMVCAHWQGLAHRIGHASRMITGVELVDVSSDLSANPMVVTQFVIDDDTGQLVLPDHQGAGHSCLAFDAATIGACLGTAPFVIAVPRHAPVMALWLAFISYQAPFTAHFSSRAPPQS